MSAKPVKPLSYSELKVWETDRYRWEQEYLLGLKDKPTFAMERGSFIHQLLFTGNANGGPFTPDQMRVHQKISDEFPKLLDKSMKTDEWIFEKEVWSQVGGVPTHGFWDGLKGKTLLELKTGASMWTPQMAREHDQIPFYLLQAVGLGIDIEEVALISFSTKNGRGIRYKVEPDLEQMVDMEERIKQAYSQMVAEGVWKKRLASTVTK